jgi:hypothetical protein
VTLHVQNAQPGEIVIAAESGLQPRPLPAAQTVGASNQACGVVVGVRPVNRRLGVP